jgi:NAD(P)-dependent dehydrogenase (short-subunit alcohol dehydrogenase family)
VDRLAAGRAAGQKIHSLPPVHLIQGTPYAKRPTAPIYRQRRRRRDVAGAAPRVPQPTFLETMMTQSFGATSTADDVLAGADLAGKRVFVTGVSAGLGVETARALVARGAHVVGAARDLAKAETATRHIRTAGQGAFDLLALDLASLASVRACADALTKDGRPFDLVIANAGVMACPFGLTADGFETQFGTNHLGHFVLVNRIAALLRPAARLVVLASAGHRFADVDLDDPGFARTSYDPWVAYGRAKTANILFAVAFDRRHKAHGIRAAAVHPGGIATELGRHAYAEPGALERQIETLNAANLAAGLPPFRLKTVPQGAATSVWAGVVADAEEIGRRYCEDCRVATVVTEADARGASGGVRPYALDPDRAEALWATSEAMVGERFE